MNEHQPHVVIIDDEASVRRGLERLLRSAGFQAVTFPSAEAYLSHGEDSRIACLILDLQMKGQTGMELFEQLQTEGCDVPVIFLTGYGDIPTSVRAIKRGAVEFLTKPVDEETLLGAIRLALAAHHDRLTRHGELESVRRRVATLTDREHQIMQYVIGGALNKQIAFELGIVEKTVKVHRGRVMEKMQAHSVAELVRLCDLAGIAPIKPS